MTPLPNAQAVLDEITVDGPWRVRFEWNARQEVVIMIVTRPDTFTGVVSEVRIQSRWVAIATRSALVRTAFGTYLGFSEHEAREAFKWRERRVLGPHINVEALHSVAEQWED